MAKALKVDAKSAIWTPGKKLPDAVKAMARLLFIEHWKATLTNQRAMDEWKPDTAYRWCIETAKIVLKIEDEEA